MWRACRIPQRIQSSLGGEEKKRDKVSGLGWLICVYVCVDVPFECFADVGAKKFE